MAEEQLARGREECGYLYLYPGSVDKCPVAMVPTDLGRDWAGLFQSAPDLLAACKAMADALRKIADGPGLIAQHGDALDLGLLAIRKAEGATNG